MVVHQHFNHLVNVFKAYISQLPNISQYKKYALKMFAIVKIDIIKKHGWNQQTCMNGD